MDNAPYAGQPAMPPVTISIIGTGTGDGGGSAPTPNGTIALTPSGQPDLKVNVITPIVAVVVRAVNLFLITFTGLITAAGVGGDQIFAATDLVSIIKSCAWAGLIVAGTGTLKNITTIFLRLEGKYPLGTASI